MKSQKKIIIPLIIVSLTLTGCGGSTIDEYGRLICESLDFLVSEEWLEENKPIFRESAEFVYRIEVIGDYGEYFQIVRDGFTLEGSPLYLIHTPVECEVKEILREDTTVPYDLDAFPDWKWPEVGDSINVFLLGQMVDGLGCYYKYNLEERLSDGFEYYIYLNYWEGYDLNDSVNKGNGFMTVFPSLCIDFISGITGDVPSSLEEDEDLESESETDDSENNDTYIENSDQS